MSEDVKIFIAIFVLIFALPLSLPFHNFKKEELKYKGNIECQEIQTKK